ncbi:MAG: hypothetical protein HYX55_08965 [Chloroflexi bacterium]|nr:hypothetical protein [Chloroflexota bacterium]
MRCALIEYNGYHEETLPTFVRLLNELGIQPDVYMSRRSSRRQPFGQNSELRFRSLWAPGIDWFGGFAFRARRYELVIVNSLEPPRTVMRVAGIRTPLLGVMHNADLLGSEELYRSFFASPNRLPLVLGRHIAKHAAVAGAPLRWVADVYVGRPAPKRADGPTTFAVSGKVDFARRNYVALLDAVGALVAEGVPVRIRIVGRATGRDGLALRTEIERRGLASVFELSPGEITHPEYLQLVAGSDFVLLLLDHTAEHMRRYFETKLTASIPLAIGLGVPLVLHRDLAAAYGVEGGGVRYDDGGLAAAMRTAIGSTPSERGAWRAALETKRSELLAESLVNLREAIATVMA